MSNFAARLFLAAPVLLGFVLPQDAVKLERKFKADETGTYRLEVKGMVQSNDIEASDTLTYKITQLLDDGKAKAEFGVTDLKVFIAGTDQSSDVNSMATTLDKLGLPDALPVQDAEWSYTMFALSQVMPSAPVKPGDSFEIKWANADKSASMSGKGKFVAVEEIEGVKAAKLEVALEFHTEGLPMEGTVKGTNWIDLASGYPIKSEARILVGDVLNWTFKLTRNTKR